MTAPIFLTFSRPTHRTRRGLTGQPLCGGGAGHRRGGWLVGRGGGWWYHSNTNHQPTGLIGTTVVA